MHSRERRRSIVRWHGTSRRSTHTSTRTRQPFGTSGRHSSPGSEKTGGAFLPGASWAFERASVAAGAGDSMANDKIQQARFLRFVAPCHAAACTCRAHANCEDGCRNNGSICSLQSALRCPVLYRGDMLTADQLTLAAPAPENSLRAPPFASPHSPPAGIRACPAPPNGPSSPCRIPAPPGRSLRRRH